MGRRALPILGTDISIEILGNIDIAGRDGESHLFLVDQRDPIHRLPQRAAPYGEQLVADVINRTETAMPQGHCFLAMELVLKAQKQAQRLQYRM